MCSQTTVYDVMNKEKQITEAYLSAQNTASKMLSSIGPKFEKIDNMAYDWHTQPSAKNIPMSGVLLQEKTKEIVQTLNNEEFKASNGWLQKFKNRHNLTLALLMIRFD